MKKPGRNLIMSQVNFYLKKVNPATGKSLIYLQFKYHKKKLVFSFNETIEPSNWNGKKQRLKSTSTITSDGKHLVNDLLDNLQGVCMAAYNREKTKGIPVPATLKKALQDFLNHNIIEDEKKSNQPTIFALIDRFSSGEIKFRGRETAKGTRQNYAACKRHLLEFSKKEAYSISFDTIDLNFFYRYTCYLKKQNLAHNTIAKDIALLKVFCGEAVDLGYTTNMQFKHKKFSMPEIEVDACYLTDEEILRLYRFDLRYCKKYEKVRDLFVFGCYCGLRYSDYSQVKPENIIEIDGELFIKMITLKTKTLVIIPVNPIILEIFKKYDANPNKLPKSMSDVKFNKYIKEIAKLIDGFDVKGRVATDPEKELWQLIASHTARRSFATNYYLQGFPTIDLMKITGHTTERSFHKYIRISKLDTAKRLQLHIKKNWSKYLLSAVG